MPNGAKLCHDIGLKIPLIRGGVKNFQSGYPVHSIRAVGSTPLRTPPLAVSAIHLEQCPVASPKYMAPSPLPRVLVLAFLGVAMLCPCLCPKWALTIAAGMAIFPE